MFKKVEIWILYVLILLSLIFAVFFGSLVREEALGSQKYRPLSKIALFLAEVPSNFLKIKAGNTQDFVVENRFPWIKEGFFGEKSSKEHYLLISRYDGKIKQGIVELVDLRTFSIQHTWNPDYDEYNAAFNKVDEFKFLERDKPDSRALPVHPLMTAKGELFIQDGVLRKIDQCSELIWQSDHDWFHHAIEAGLNESIWVPSHINPHQLRKDIINRKPSNEGGYLDDAIVNISNDGQILYEKSVSNILIENQLEPLLFSVGGPSLNNDPIHLNDIQPVFIDSEFMKSGDLFLSLRNQSMIIHYRPSTEKIMWIGFGKTFHQHDVDILDGGTISIFNNNLKMSSSGSLVDGHNEVLIYNFNTQEYTSYFKEELAKSYVRTRSQGLNQIVNDGGLFVEESNFGRLLYFNPDGSVRWTYLNRAGDGQVYTLAWTRLLHTEQDIIKVNEFLKNKRVCND